MEFRFFTTLIGFVFLFLMGYQFPGLLPISIMLFGVFGLLVLVDSVLLFKQKGMKAQRLLPEKLSNGDDNPVEITLKNAYNFKVTLKIIDEMPFQYQKRDFEINTHLDKLTDKKITYTLRPLERGEYHFGNLNVYVTSPIGLLTRRFQFGNHAMVPNYPSFLQLKKYMLLAFSNRIFEFGLKKIRRIGHTMEFEQIKEYVPGDDIRTINWKATAKRNQMMVNQFQDEFLVSLV